MTGAELIDRQLTTRVRLLEAIEFLSDDELLAPGAVNDNSIRDILLLLSVWGAELITGLMRLDQGKKPARLLAALADPAAYNRDQLAHFSDRDLDRIFDDLQGVQKHLEAWLTELDDRVLADRGAFRWLNGRPLWEIVRDAAYGLERSFLPAVEAYAAARRPAA